MTNNIPFDDSTLGTPGNSEFVDATASEGRPAPSGYELLEEVGRGGMGVVYRAFDRRLQREVAIKVLREGVQANSVLATRFRREARLTGQLEHPGIPAVHEMGTLADGRPFLAMKLVRGQTLHDLLEKSAELGLDRGRFIAIFEQICHAVGYAHSHRVIHRDLKPANVMVGSHGEVQVMDWGLAKILNPDGDDHEEPEEFDEPTATLDLRLGEQSSRTIESATETGSILGTPAYMPPEQAAGQIRLLDARSDVFGLGAILCQILTGRPPYDGKGNFERHMQAFHGELSDALARLDACGAEPELIALCKRCLAVKKEDRPADGTAVATEVARIRQAFEERARRAELERAAAVVREAEQRRRRRVVQWAGIAVSVVLLVGLIASLWQMRRAIHAEGQARQNEALAKLNAELARAERDAKNSALVAEMQARKEAENRRAEADAARQESQSRLKQIEKGNEILLSIFADLDVREDPGRTEPLGAVLAKRLLKAAEQLEGEAVGDPLAVGNLQSRLGLTMVNLGSAHEAIPLLQKARAVHTSLLGADHPRTLVTMNNLALAYRDAGQLDKALTLWQETWKRMTAQFGADHPDTLLCANNLALAYRDVGQFDEARKLWEETLSHMKTTLGADHPGTLTVMSNLAFCHRAAGDLEKALRIWQETLMHMKTRFGVDHPHTLTTMNNVASSYQAAGKLDQALPLLEEVLRLRKAKLGSDHPDTLISMNNLAETYRTAGMLEQALPLLEETLTLMKAKLGADHPNTLATMNNLALGYMSASDFDRAIPLLEDSASGVERHQFQLDSARGIIFNTINGYEQVGQIEKAEQWQRKWLAVVMERSGNRSPAYADELAALGRLLLRQAKWAEAEPKLRECLAIREKTQPDAWTTFHAMSVLGGALLSQAARAEDDGKKTKLLAEAEPLLLKGLHGMEQRASAIPENLGIAPILEAIDRLIELFTAKNQPDEVEKYRKLREKHLSLKNDAK